MSRGPNRATLAGLAKVLGDDALFADASDGWRILVVPRRRLALALGVTVGTVQDRLAALRAAGLARGNGTVELDRARIEAAAGGRILPVCDIEPNGIPADVTGGLDPLDVALEACELALAAADAGDIDTENRALRVIHTMVKSARARGFARGVARGLSEDRADLEPLMSHEMNDMSTSHLISSSKSAREIRAETRAEDPSPRAPSVVTSRGEAVPAVDRGFDADEVGWDEDEMDEVLGPLQAICATRALKPINVHRKMADAARAWPKRWVQRAVALIAADCAGIDHPGAVLYRAMVEGRLRYFPLEDPADPITPTRCDSQAPAPPPDPLVEEVERIRAEMDAPPDEPLPMSDALAAMRARLRPHREEAS